MDDVYYLDSSTIARIDDGVLVIFERGTGKFMRLGAEAQAALLQLLCPGDCDLLAAARDEGAAPTRPAPLQATPDPVMTLGAAAGPDVPLLGVLLPDNTWAELATGQLHAGYNRDLAQAVADNRGGVVRAFRDGRDE
jgi:hypothetical protein